MRDFIGFSVLAFTFEIVLIFGSPTANAAEADKQFKLLATIPIGEPIMATSAISDGVMYIRGSHHLFAIGQLRQVN